MLISSLSKSWSFIGSVVPMKLSFMFPMVRGGGILMFSLLFLGIPSCNLPENNARADKQVLSGEIIRTVNILINGIQSENDLQSFLRGNFDLSNINVTSFDGNTNGSFKQEQKRYSRVREAYSSKARTVKKLLARRGINTFRIDLFIRLFKKEQIVQVWAKKKYIDTFTHIIDYPFCRTSGELGPKRKEGDLQIPEGFYHLSYFNPASNYYLSLKINYPNRSDRIKGHPQQPGGNIFIHGSCATIGCIPITDPYIKELYVMAVEAHSSGSERIPVHIFPTRLQKDSWQVLKKEYSSDTSLISFWQNLRPGYLAFANNKEVPDIHVDNNGAYDIR